MSFVTVCQSEGEVADVPDVTQDEKPKKGRKGAKAKDEAEPVRRWCLSGI